MMTDPKYVAIPIASIDATRAICTTAVLLMGIYKYRGYIEPSINAVANKYRIILFHGILKTSFLLEKK
jgi:hypothetical protein